MSSWLTILRPTLLRLLFDSLNLSVNLPGICSLLLNNVEFLLISLGDALLPDVFANLLLLHTIVNG